MAAAGISQTPDHWGNDYFDDTYARNGVKESFEGYCTDVWFDEAMKFIENTESVLSSAIYQPTLHTVPTVSQTLQ